MLRTFAKLAYTPNCSHVGLLSWSSKRGGHALFKICPCFSTGEIYEWDNELLMVVVVVCVYMCVFMCLALEGGALESVEVEFFSSFSSFSRGLLHVL